MSVGPVPRVQSVAASVVAAISAAPNPYAWVEKVRATTSQKAAPRAEFTTVVAIR